ncbi:MAG: hypothetical protein ACLQU4_00010 [Limisphaerales bacterium]
MSKSLVNDLEERGYFKGLAIVKAQELKKEFETRGWSAIFSESHRFFHADAEDLAEGGIGSFIREVEPFLVAEGVRLPEIQDDRSEEGYVVRVGGAAHQIYDAAEFRRECSEKQWGLIWGLSMARGFQIVDQLLASVGSSESVYAVNGGNDLFALFLTPALFQIITEHPESSSKDAPYLPTDEYPWFGQPHDE